MKKYPLRKLTFTLLVIVMTSCADGPGNGTSGNSSPEVLPTTLAIVRLADLPKIESNHGPMPDDQREAESSTFDVEQIMNGYTDEYVESIHSCSSHDHLFNVYPGVVYNALDLLKYGTPTAIDILPNTMKAWLSGVGPIFDQPPAIVAPFEGGNPEAEVLSLISALTRDIEFSKIPTETKIEFFSLKSTESKSDNRIQELTLGFAPVNLNASSDNSFSETEIKNKLAFSVERCFGAVNVQYLKPLEAIKTAALESMPVTVLKSNLCQRVVGQIESNLLSSTIKSGITSGIGGGTESVEVGLKNENAVEDSLSAEETTVFLTMIGPSSKIVMINSLSDLKQVIDDYFAKSQPAYASSLLQMLDKSSAWVQMCGKVKAKKKGMAAVTLKGSSTDHRGTAIYTSFLVDVSLPTSSNEQKKQLKDYILDRGMVYGEISNKNRSFSGEKNITEDMVLETATGYAIQLSNRKIGAFDTYSYATTGEACKVYTDLEVAIGPKTIYLTHGGSSYHSGEKLRSGWFIW